MTIQDNIDTIRGAVKGKDVREAIAQLGEAIRDIPDVSGSLDDLNTAVTNANNIIATIGTTAQNAADNAATTAATNAVKNVTGQLQAAQADANQTIVDLDNANKQVNKQLIDAQAVIDSNATTLAQVQEQSENIQSIATYNQEQIDKGTVATQDQINSISSSLEEKANNNEVRKKDENITLNDCDSEMITAIQGSEGASFELLSIPRDYSVTPVKTNFFFQSDNLFDKSDIIANNFVSWVSGVLVENEKYYSSNYIEVIGSTLYTRNIEHQIAFYDENKVYISGINGSSTELKYATFTTPSNAKYVRMTLIPSLLESTQLIKGDIKNILTNYIPFGYGILEKFFGQTKIKEENLLDGIISDKNIKSDSKILTLEIGKNLFNKNTAINNYFVNWDSGNLMSNDNYYASDFIKVEPNSTITRSYDTHIAYYDIEKNFISGLNKNGNQTVNIPSDCQYVRVDIDKRVYDINKFQIEYGEEETSYEEYGFKIPTQKNNLPIFIPQLNEKIDKFKQSRFYGKKVSWYGTSITQGYAWCNIVNKAFNFTATNNGVGGTSICKENENSSMCTQNRMLGKYSSVTDPNTGAVTLSGTPIPSDVEIIFVEGGTNDWARNWAIGDKEFSENPNDQTFAGACHLMFKNLTELFPNAEIIIVGSPFGKMANRNVFDNKYGLLNNNNLQTVEYGDILLDIAGKWGIKGFNMGREMQVHDNNVATLIPDGLHLTTTQAQKIASDVIINYLLTLG